MVYLKSIILHDFKGMLQLRDLKQNFREQIKAQLSLKPPRAEFSQT